MTARPPLYPSSSFLLGSLKALNADELGLLQRVRERSGDVARIRMLHTHAVLVSGASGVQRVLADNVRNYSKRAFFYRVARLILGDGLITASGDKWKENRLLAQPSFRREQMQQMEAVMEESARAAIATIRPDEDVDVFALMLPLTLRIAGLALFSVDLTKQADGFAEAFSGALTYLDYRLSHPWAAPSWIPTAANRRFLKTVTFLRGACAQLIAQRRALASPPQDLLQALLPLDEQQLIDEVLTMLIAANETTATALTWAVYFLAQMPDPPNLEAFIKEVLRVRPPVWLLQRQADADDVVDGFAIKKGDAVLVSPFVVHHHPGMWDQPERFMPERFVGAPVSKFAFLPFSAGQRKCIGDGFAMMQMTIVLRTLLERFRPMATGPIEAKPVVTLRPKQRLIVRFK